MQNAHVRVQRVQKVRPDFGRLVQRERFLGWTGLTAGGFVSLTALRAEDGGIARRAMSMKSALRDLPFCVIGRNKHSADWLTALASPLSGYAGLPPQAGEE